MKVLVTGCAGFIGFHVSKFLLERGDKVIGVDCLTDFVYDSTIKHKRLEILKTYFDFKMHQVCFSDIHSYAEDVDVVCHLAAHAGVRNSTLRPDRYISENVELFGRLLYQYKDVGNFVFASSSSVYGDCMVLPSHEGMDISKPVSIYAATKAMDEILAHSYHKIFNTKITGLRFFTVYGPWGRPDMALMIFIKNILLRQTIDVYGHGEMSRDFTYIDDIVNGIVKCIDNPQSFEIFNIGRGKPEKLLDFISIIEKCLDIKAKINLMPMQLGDVKSSFADISKIKKFYDYEPKININEGIPKTVNWFIDYAKNIL